MKVYIVFKQNIFGDDKLLWVYANKVDAEKMTDMDDIYMEEHEVIE